MDLSNDIAIIHLSSDATFNDFVQPICLWNAHKTSLSEVIGRYGSVIGWGRTESDKLSHVLRQASMPVVESIDCLSTHRSFFGSILSKTNFCAGLRNGLFNCKMLPTVWISWTNFLGTSICEGDSGGSMTFENNGLHYIRGIVSLTTMLPNETTQELVCDPTHFVIFTDVAQYLPWIDDNDCDNDTKECVNNIRCDKQWVKFSLRFNLYKLNLNFISASSCFCCIKHRFYLRCMPILNFPLVECKQFLIKKFFVLDSEQV